MCAILFVDVCGILTSALKAKKDTFYVEVHCSLDTGMSWSSILSFSHEFLIRGVCGTPGFAKPDEQDLPESLSEWVVGGIEWRRVC